MSIERRQHPRFPCRVEVLIDGRPAPIAATTRDVSVGGVFLYSDDPRPLNDAVDLTIKAETRTIRARGLVVHHLPDVGFGVQFLELTDADGDRLRGFLSEVERRAGADPEWATPA
jgi:hypothetical protein